MLGQKPAQVHRAIDHAELGPRALHAMAQARRIATVIAVPHDHVPPVPRRLLLPLRGRHRYPHRFTPRALERVPRIDRRHYESAAPRTYVFAAIVGRGVHRVHRSEGGGQRVGLGPRRAGPKVVVDQEFANGDAAGPRNRLLVVLVASGFGEPLQGFVQVEGDGDVSRVFAAWRAFRGRGRLRLIRLLTLGHVDHSSFLITGLHYHYTPPCEGCMVDYQHAPENISSALDYTIQHGILQA